MDVGRFCGVLGAEKGAKHQRIAEYVKTSCELYRGMGFGPREEWLVEQTMDALTQFLRDVRCTDAERWAIDEFLSLASEELPGMP